MSCQLAAIERRDDSNLAAACCLQGSNRIVRRDLRRQDPSGPLGGEPEPRERLSTAAEVNWRHQGRSIFDRIRLFLYSRF